MWVAIDYRMSAQLASRISHLALLNDQSQRHGDVTLHRAAAQELDGLFHTQAAHFGGLLGDGGGQGSGFHGGHGVIHSVEADEDDLRSLETVERELADKKDVD